MLDTLNSSVNISGAFSNEYRPSPQPDCRHKTAGEVEWAALLIKELFSPCLEQHEDRAGS